MLKIHASELNRIVQCNGFVSMEVNQTSIERPKSESQREGDAAHYLAAKALEQPGIDLKTFKDQPAPNGVFITDEMIEHVFGYVQTISNRGIGQVEVSTTFDILPSVTIAGRADHIFYNETTRTLHVDDFKYGWRLVEPEKNATLLAYAMGFCALHEIDPTDYVFTIHQPRPYHQNGSERSIRMNLREFDKAVKTLEQTLVVCGPKSNLRTGPHCSNCEFLATCPAARRASLNAIDVSSSIFQDDLTDQELSFHLVNLYRAQQSINERVDVLKEQAEHRLKTGAQMPDFMLEPTMSHLRWKLYVTSEILQAITGLDLTKQSLVTPTQAKKRGLDEKIFEVLSERVSTGVRLKQINVSARAKQIFNPKGE